LLCRYGVGDDSFKVGEALGDSCVCCLLLFWGCNCLVVVGLGTCENMLVRSLAGIGVGIVVGIGVGISVD
jgi:hypothetical protein